MPLPLAQETNFVGTCLGAPSAVPSRRINYSSFLIIKVSALTIQLTRASLMSSQLKNVLAISLSCAKLASRGRAGLVLRPQQVPAYALSSSITHVLPGRECQARLAPPPLLVRRLLTTSFQ